MKNAQFAAIARRAREKAQALRDLKLSDGRRLGQLNPVELTELAATEKSRRAALDEAESAMLLLIGMNLK